MTDTLLDYHEILKILIAFCLAIVLCGVVVPWCVTTTLKDNWGKMPDDIDKTIYTIIKIGGIAFFPLVCILATMSFPYDFAGILLGVTLLYLVGLRYDLRGATSLLRLVAILITSLLYPLHFATSVTSAIVIYLFAVYVIEMVKLMDGMNGLASCTVAVALIVLSVLSIAQGDYHDAMMGMLTAAVVLPFWLMKMFRKSWRKVIMGNAGAYVMGYMLVFMFFTISTNSYRTIYSHTLAIAIAVLIIPMLDTLRVIGSRARDGRSIIMPDRNTINFKLLRTGMPNGTIFPTYITMLILFPVIAWALLHCGLSATATIGLEVVLWVVVELTINFFIHRREKRSHQKEWNRVYGREAWNANGPYEQIIAKQLQFGTMGLPTEMLLPDEQAFIDDKMSPIEQAGKRLFDIIVSGLCLILFSPLFLLCYILIKLDDGKEVLFRQERIGRYGKPFNMFKFRTMTVDAESMGPQLSHAHGEDDPRLTTIGRFLRAHHLDELPQLWNVFRGDMSLIGYRPERKYYIDQIMQHDPRYAFLYQIRPGVTSYATLYNGYTDTMEKMLRRLELDLYYLSHRSTWVDCKILFLTFAAIAFGKKF